MISPESGSTSPTSRFVKEFLIEDIMKDNLAVDFPTVGQLLESVQDRIDKYFPIAHDGILEIDGAERWNSSPQTEEY